MKISKKIILLLAVSSLVGSNAEGKIINDKDSNGKIYARYIYDGSFRQTPIHKNNFIIKEVPLTHALGMSSCSNEVFSDYSKVYTPNPHTVASAVEHLLVELEKEGISRLDLFKNKVEIKVTNLGCNNILGEASEHDDITLFSNQYNFTSEPEDVYSTTLHEIGHVVRYTYINDDTFDLYRKIRGIPKEWSEDSDSWTQNAGEVFAEDFKQIFLPNSMTNRNKTEMDSIPEPIKTKVKELIINSIKNHYYFPDVTLTHWAIEPIMELNKKGIINKQDFGTNDLFDPDSQISRQQFHRWLSLAIANKNELNSIKIIDPTTKLVYKHDISKAITKKEVISFINSVISSSKDTWLYGLDTNEHLGRIYTRGVKNGGVQPTYSENDPISRSEAALIIYALMNQK